MTDGALSQSPEAAQSKPPRSNQTPDQKSQLPALPAMALTPKAFVSPGSGPAGANVGRRKQGWSASDVDRPAMSLLHRFRAPLPPGQTPRSGGSQPPLDARLPAPPTTSQTGSGWLPPQESGDRESRWPHGFHGQV